MSATWPALDELETALAGGDSLPWNVDPQDDQHVRDCNRRGVGTVFLPDDASAIVAAVNLAPKLIAAVRAVEALCDEAEADSAPAYPPMWVGDVRDVLAIALGDPQPDTRQCPVTRDDGYRCLEHVPHEQHVDSLGRRW